VTYRISINNRYMSGTDTLTKFKLCANYTTSYLNTSNMFNVTRSNTKIAITEFHQVTGKALQVLKVRG